MSYQYPLPAGYPPPGATYAMNQQPPPPNQGPPPGHQDSVPQGYYPPPMPNQHPGYYPPPPEQQQPPGNMYPGYNHPQHPQPAGYPPVGSYYPPPAGGPSSPGSASYPPAEIPSPGQHPGALPYDYQNRGQGQPPTPQWPAPPPIITPPPHASDFDIAAELNEAAELMKGGGKEQKRQSTVAAENTDRRPFFIVSEVNKCVLDVRGDNPKPFTAVGLWKKKKEVAPNQLWYIGEDGFLRSKLNDLGVMAAGNDRELLTTVMNGDPRQQWLFDGNKIVNKVFSSECLTVKKGLVRIRDDAEVVTSTYEGKPTQHWRREYVDA